MLELKHKYMYTRLHMYIYINIYVLLIKPYVGKYGANDLIYWNRIKLFLRKHLPLTTFLLSESHEFLHGLFVSFCGSFNLTPMECIYAWCKIRLSAYHTRAFQHNSFYTMKHEKLGPQLQLYKWYGTYEL